MKPHHDAPEFPDAEPFAHSLREELDSLPGPDPAVFAAIRRAAIRHTAPNRHHAHRRRWTSWRPLTAAAVLLAAAGAMLYWQTIRPDEPPQPTPAETLASILFLLRDAAPADMHDADVTTPVVRQSLMEQLSEMLWMDGTSGGFIPPEAEDRDNLSTTIQWHSMRGSADQRCG